MMSSLIIVHAARLGLPYLIGHPSLVSPYLPCGLTLSPHILPLALIISPHCLTHRLLPSFIPPRSLALECSSQQIHSFAHHFPCRRCADHTNLVGQSPLSAASRNLPSNIVLTTHRGASDGRTMSLSRNFLTLSYVLCFHFCLRPFSNFPFHPRHFSRS